MTPGSKLEDMEKAELLDALKRNRWVQSRAAHDLGITLRKLGYRLKKYGLDRKGEERTPLPGERLTTGKRLGLRCP